MHKVVFDSVAVLTSSESWFMPYAENFVSSLQKEEKSAELFNDHKDIPESYQIVFILSYFRLIEEEFLKLHKHNLVVHESDLPKGRGWAPLFWQILEGKNRIPIVLFEAQAGADEGDIYLKDFIELTGHELHDEIRHLQAEKTISLCNRFLVEYSDIKPVKQQGEPTVYPKRTPKDSQLDIDKTIDEQFNLLRIVNNEQFPAFFYKNGHKYILKIYRQDKLNDGNSQY